MVGGRVRKGLHLIRGLHSKCKYLKFVLEAWQKYVRQKKGLGLIIQAGGGGSIQRGVVVSIPY
jgi:hypothetical protein